MNKNTVSSFSGSNFFRMYFETNQKIKDVMSDGRMWLNSRSWCILNLNNISLYFLHSLNMTPAVYRFLSLFAVFPFDFLSASPKLTELT